MKFDQNSTRFRSVDVEIWSKQAEIFRSNYDAEFRSKSDLFSRMISGRNICKFDVEICSICFSGFYLHHCIFGPLRFMSTRSYRQGTVGAFSNDFSWLEFFFLCVQPRWSLADYVVRINRVATWRLNLTWAMWWCQAWVALSILKSFICYLSRPCVITWCICWNDCSYFFLFSKRSKRQMPLASGLFSRSWTQIRV